MTMPTFNVVAGTMDDAIAVNSVLEHPDPYHVKGFCIAEEFIGDAAQEVWECLSDQRQRLVYGVAGALVGTVLGLALALVGHLPLYAALIGTSLVGFVGWHGAQGQNGADERMGHAVSMRASERYEGMTRARSIECFVGGLPAYGEGMGNKTVAELMAMMEPLLPKADAWLDANPAVIAELKAIKARFYQGG